MYFYQKFQHNANLIKFGDIDILIWSQNLKLVYLLDFFDILNVQVKHLD